MEQENIVGSLLELVERPALCVCDGKIVQLNNAASQIMLQPVQNISDLLPPNNCAYENFQGGTLTLTMTIFGNSYNAQVSRIGNYDIFILEDDDSQLRAIALAAQNLRNPLNNLITTAELLPCKDNKYMGQLHRSLNRLQRIVCNMSDSYRYQQDQLIRSETTNIVSVFNESMEAIATHLESCGIKLQYEGLEEAIYGLADREMLERAIYNLISNAVKFMTDNHKIMAKLTQNSSHLSFTLQTSGVPVNTVGIFNHYQRQPGIEDSRHGIGLGLPLVRAVAAAHGGTVLIDRPDEATTRFTMTISIAESKETVLRSSISIPVSNYAGERDRGLLELSEILPVEAYNNKNESHSTPV